MSDPETCCGAGASEILLFPCSGVSDTGELADQTARRMHREGVGKMSCLAGISGGAKNILAMARSAGCLLALNGCPLDCASLTLRQAGFTNLLELRVTDLGLPKGKSPVTKKNLDKVFRAAQALVCAAPARPAAGAVRECC